MSLLVTFFVVSILVSFICSILEAVLLSITPSYVGIKQQEQAPIAADLSKFKADIDRPLAAILTLNTIAHTVGAIGVGAQAAVMFGSTKIELFGQAIISWEALIAGLMTLCILILSEVIPKTLGANNWEKLTPITVKTLKLMLIVLSPLVWLSQLITKNFKRDKDKPVLSRTDFAVMANLGTEAGVLEKGEQKIIHNLLRFNRVQAKDIMTPRVVTLMADEAMTLREFHDQHEELVFSRVPVFQENSDNITGYILKDELLLNLVDEKDSMTLKEIRRDVIIVHKFLAIPNLLDMLINKKEHMALVVDEFGGFEGVVSMEDIIETLLGIEIVDESDNDEDMQALARRNWERRARRMGIIEDEEIQTEESNTE